VLTASAAEKLRAEPGQILDAVIRRQDGGNAETVFLELTVASVLPLALAARDQAFAPLDLVVAVEDYREWQRVDRYGWGGDEPLDDPFADFRLYAATLDDVEPLRLHLKTLNIEVDSAADAIAQVRRIDADLTLMFAVILALTVLGFATAIGLNQVASVARKRETLAVLRLMGFRSHQIMIFPIVQGSVVAVCGALVALAVFALTDPILGALFRDVVETRGSLTKLPSHYVVLVILGAVAIAAAASLFASRQAMKISPSRELRHV
jgi:putative ABC transport system permease protein